MTHDYQQEYTEFTGKYSQGTIGPEEVGAMVLKWGQYIGEANSILAQAEQAYITKSAETIQIVEDNGKQISSVKAKTLTDASEEGLAKIRAKSHKETIDTQIITLATFQKGVSTEFVKGS